MSTDTPSTPVRRQPAASDPQRPPHRWRRLMATGLKVALPIALLVGGGGLAVGLMETGPKAARQAPTRQAKLVEVTPVRVDRATVTVHAMGTVTADRQVDLRPQVGGRVSWVSDEFMPGGILGAGDPLLRIDPKDFELVVRQKAAALATAESNLKIEQGQQSIAKREYELLGETIKPEDRELVLRQPQLATVQAAVDTAKSTLEQARLDLARTHVTAPFNAVVQSRDVNLGTQVSTTTSLTTLVGTDAYLVEVAVPVDQLKWLRVPHKNGEAGSAVRVNESRLGAEATGRAASRGQPARSEGGWRSFWWPWTSGGA